MVQTLFDNLPWIVGWLALFSFLAVYVWSRERRREREALYRSEAIRKIAEIGSDVSEPVLQLLRESMAAWKDEPSPANMGPLQAREYYRNRTIQKIAEASGAGAEAALALLQQEQSIYSRRTRMGLKLGGAICLTVGVLLIIILRQIVPPGPPRVPERSYPDRSWGGSPGICLFQCGERLIGSRFWAATTGAGGIAQAIMAHIQLPDGLLVSAVCLLSGRRRPDH